MAAIDYNSNRSTLNDLLKDPATPMDIKDIIIQNTYHEEVHKIVVSPAPPIVQQEEIMSLEDFNDLLSLPTIQVLRLNRDSS